MRAINLQVEASPLAPRISRTYLSGMRSVLGTRFEDVSLVLSELVTNSVQHGRGAVGVVVEASDSRIRLEVSDKGPGFALDAPRGNGMGLEIIQEIAESWGIDQDGGCTVWVEIALEG